MTARNEAEREQARTWLSVQDVATHFGVSDAQVRQWIEDGDLTAFDASRKDAKRKDFRVRPEWLQKFEEKRTKHAAA